MKIRTLQTKIWNDDWFASLTSMEKLAFIYFLTNPHINLCGIYELSDRVICFELGITQSQLKAIKEKFSGKITFVAGYVSINNIERYDDYKGGLLLKAKEKQLNEIPLDILSEIRGRVSIPHQRGIDTSNSNSNSNSNSKVIEGGVGETKTSKNSHEPCTSEELQSIASELNIPLEVVEKKHQSIMEMIQVGEFDKKKNKTVYFTLKRWLDLDMKRGYVRRSTGVISI